MGVIKAVCTSDIKGIQKTERGTIELRPNWGIEGDAHAAPWHRQVSLLSYEQIEAFKNRGAEVGNGAFGENIIVEGFDLKSLPVGTRFTYNDVVLDMGSIALEKGVEYQLYFAASNNFYPPSVQPSWVAANDCIDIAHGSAYYGDDTTLIFSGTVVLQET